MTCIFCIWFGFVAVFTNPAPLFFLVHYTSYLQQLGEAQRSAEYAWNKSCYSGIDYTIGDDSPVLDAVEKFAAYNVGCLVTTDTTGMFIYYLNKVAAHYYLTLSFSCHKTICKSYIGKLSGVISERDYVTKIALLGKTVSSAVPCHAHTC